jgi:hypothetical protein
VQRCLRVLLAALWLSLLAAARGAGACTDAPACTIPPSGTLPNGAVVGGSFDTVYLPLWAFSDASIADLWDGLEADQCDWDEGWGFWDVSNLSFSLARLLNAAQTVWIVRQYAKHQGFGLWRSVSGIPDADFTKGQWWDFVAGYGGDEWTPGCKIKSNGEHVQTTDEYNVLHLGGAYLSAVLPRASTLVHETVHQDVGHITATLCNPSSKSCDMQYGQYNSNTMQINFLHDALVTFEMTSVNGQTVRQVVVVGDTCRWIPKFAPDELTQITSRANGSMKRFATDAWPGWKTSLMNEVAAKQAEGVWPCVHCDPQQWVFKPGTCAQKACNPTINVQNAGVNSHNQMACQTYNASLGGAGFTPQKAAAAQQTLTLSTLACLPPEEDAARAFCDAQKQAASTVGDIDPCGWLEPVYGKTVSKLDCVQEFCLERWNATGGWRPGQDPFGCLDYLCGEDTACGDSAGKQECTDEFFMAHADPEFYVAGCRYDGCKAPEIACLLDLHKQGQWSYGDPIPGNCSLTTVLCEILSRLAALVAVNRNPIIDPGPIHELIERADAGNPGTSFHRYANDLRTQAVGAGVAEVNRLARRLTTAPEMIAALYQSGPGQFVWLYGKQGFAEVLGPGIENVDAVPIRPEELSAQGQAALADFLRMRATLPPEGVKGAIGTFTP